VTTTSSGTCRSPRPAIGYVAYVAYVSTLVGFGLWNRLIGLYSVSRVAQFSPLADDIADVPA
jgi:drug/metabolite transporter (DMT)-like permease